MHVYSSHDRRAGVYAVLATIAVALAIALSATADAFSLGPPWLVSSPTVAGAYALLYRLVDTAAWKWQWLHRLGLIDTPTVDGIYDGHLLSSFHPDEIPVRIEIDQRWTRLSVRFSVVGVTTSSSRSVAADLAADGHRDARLTYTYKNIINPVVADSDMGDHDGTADLYFDTTTGAVRGRYFNARGRQGTITLQRRVDKSS